MDKGDQRTARLLHNRGASQALGQTGLSSAGIKLAVIPCSHWSLFMHLAHDTPIPLSSEISILQHSGLPSAKAVLKKVQGARNRPPPLRLEHQAARQVAMALACRPVTQFMEAGCVELYPGFKESLLILDQGRAIKQLPVAGRSLRLLQTITHVLLGHVAGERLPSDEEQSALCSFLHTLDEGHRTALQLTEHDPFMALAQQQDKHGLSLLYLAVSKGMTWLVGWLLKTQPSSFLATAPFTGANDANSNPLHLAVDNCDQSMVCLLLEKSADINCRDMCGRTVLFRALQRNAKSIAHLLLDKGADVNIPDDFGTSPLHLLVHAGDRDMISALFAKGADVNSVDHLGRTALYWAILQGDVVMVSFLVERGADVNVVDALTNSALHSATAPGQDVGIAALLLEGGAEVNVVDGLGRTPLVWAVNCGHRSAVRLLLENGADANRSDYLTGTPLHTAVVNDDQGMVCFLLQNGADINCRNYNGKSPLYWAVENRRNNMVRLLLEHNADVSRRTDSGETALHEAVDQGNERVIRLLMQNSADANAQDCCGKSPLSLAMHREDVRIVQLLQNRGAAQEPERAYGPPL